MSKQKFPPKILGIYDPESNNGRWQGPYQFCPEQWCIAYEKLGHTWAPIPGETRDVVFISEEEHQHLMAEKDKRIERLRDALNEHWLVEQITKWKHAWMDVKGTDERDRKNYFNKAFGIDANMKYDLARRIIAALQEDK